MGVTGSVGKTSVKDLLAAALAARWSRSASAGRSTTSSGVPLTLLNAPDGTEALVVEMGAAASGTSPSCAPWPAHGRRRHPGGRGAHRAVRHGRRRGRGQGRAGRGPPGGGTAVLNADDPGWRPWRRARRRRGRHLRRRRRRAGRGGGARRRPAARRSASSPWGARRGAPGGAWAHMVENALAAAAAAWPAACRSTAWPTGWPGARCRTGAWSWSACRRAAPRPQRRLQRQPDLDGRGAAVARRCSRGRRVAVLGVMAELGDWQRRRPPGGGRPGRRAGHRGRGGRRRRPTAARSSPTSPRPAARPRAARRRRRRAAQGQPGLASVAAPWPGPAWNRCGGGPPLPYQDATDSGSGVSRS